MWSILEDDNLTLLSRNHKTTQEIIKPKNTNFINKTTGKKIEKMKNVFHVEITLNPNQNT